MTSRWFLAHAKTTEDADIDAWKAQLEARMGYDSVPAEVTPGRDDYKKRSRALGGWHAWSRDVPVAENWESEPLFHGIVVPVGHLDEPSVGRATSDLVMGFLRRGKYAYAWDVTTSELARIADVRTLDSDSWTMTATLLLERQPVHAA